MNKFEEKRSKSIERIREVALNLFAAHGYDKTSIRQIAQEAGMATGLLYNYYNSKEDLLSDLYRHWHQQLRLTLQPDGDGGKSNIVEAYIRQTIRGVKAHRFLWKLIYGIRMQSPLIRQLDGEMKPENDLLYKQVEASLAQAGSPFPGLEAKLLFATLDGLIQHYLLQDAFPLDDLGNLLIMKYRQSTPM